MSAREDVDSCIDAAEFASNTAGIGFAVGGYMAHDPVAVLDEHGCPKEMDP